MANNPRREITIVLSGDAKGLIGTVEVAEQAAKKLGVTLESVSAKAKKAGKDVDDSAKQIEASNKRTAAGIALVASAAVVGFSALVKHQLNVIDATGKMAQRLGVSTEFLSSMGYAAKSSGADMQSLSTSLQSLAESQTKAAAGQKQYAAAFAALGVPVRDAAGHLRSLADLLPDIAERFRTMPDGPNKAAIAVKLFGTEGAKLIPMLNQGRDGLAAMRDEAAKLGLVIDDDLKRQATELNDNLARMKDMATGAANTFLREMLPALNSTTGGMRDAKAQGESMRGMAETLATALKYLALALYAVVAVVKAVATTVAAAVVSMGIGLSTIRQNTETFFGAAKTALSQTMRLDFKGVLGTWSDAATSMTGNASKGFAELKGNAKMAMGDISGLWTDLVAKKHQLFDGVGANPLPNEASAGGKKDISSDWAARIGKVREAAKAALPDLTNLANMVDRLQGKAGTPYDAADAQYINSVRELASKAAAEIAKADDAVAKGHMSVADAAQVEASAQKLVTDGITAASAARDEAYTKIKRQLDVSGRLIEQMEQEARLAGLSDRDQAIARAGFAYEQEARQQNLHLTKEQTEAEKRRVEAAAAASFDMQKIAEQQRQIAQEYVGYWENAAGSISKAFGDLTVSGLRKWKDFGRSSLSIAKQWVSDMIAQFMRLRVFGPLLSGAMGSVAGWLGIVGDLSGSSLSYGQNYYGSGGTIGATAGSVGGDSSGGSPYGSYVQNGVSAYKLYNAAGGISLSGGTIVGGNSIVSGPGLGGAGTAYNMPGGTLLYQNGTTVTPYSPYGGNFAAGGYSVPYASVGGGLLGAYYGSKQGSGGFSTAASTVSYGALGAGIAGTAAGVAGGASLGAAAGGAFGTAAAGMSWVPVVGWILAAIAAIDAISGGKVFGTKYQATQGQTYLNLGPDGGNATAVLTEKRQGALFSGAKWRTRQIEASAEAQKAADALYDSISKTMVQGAQKLGIDVPSMITANLQIQANYSKGKLKSTDYMVNYLGQTWKEATAEAAAKRIGAEALVKVVEASAGSVAQSIAQQFRESADLLADGAATMLAAQADIVKGNSLVALGSSATLAQVVAFTQRMQADGEALADTYNRLVQASAQYLQFVGQFKPASTGFGASLDAIAKQMQANIDQANALAQAAGLQHAREEDLANIHQFAAQQAAAAIAQLSSAAQDLAAKLYNVTGNSLAAVSAQLDKLQGKTQSALQLAIGDKSPLGEKQKLDLALQGLRSGLTSADDVLGLGRQLYASSADYTGLYNKVQEILGMPGAGGQQSLQDAIGQYTSLYAQQQQLQRQAAAMSRFNDAKTLAQYVADISTTHGIGYAEAASGLGFNLSDLAKDLGVTNLVGYLDNLKLADIPGTTMDASASIVTAIQQLGRDLIQTLTGGPITSATVTNATPIASNDPQVIALLASINERLGAIEGSSSTTASTNTQMAKQGLTDALRTIAGSRRDGLSNV